MFEHSLIDLETRPQTQRRRRWISLPIAVGLHVVGLTAFAFASYWNVGAVPEPDLIAGPLIMVTLPELPGGGGGGRQQPPREPEQRAPEQPQRPTQPVQPTEETVPESVPTPTTSAPLDDLFEDLLAGDETAGDPGLPGGCPGCSVGPGVGPDPIGPGTGEDGGGGEPAPIRFTVGMTRPEAIHRVQPRYTETARRAGVQGTVIVEAIIDEKGNVINARVLRGLPLGLDREAVDAILQWKFRPAMLNDRPVRVYFNLTATFTIQR